ncbi:MAG: helix-turn-helix domain-containing protein [Egibacteraceae bacterium]
MSAGDILRRARAAAGLSQRAVAERAGVTQPEVSAYENGHRQPTVPTLQRLIAATGYNLRLELQPEPADQGASYQPMTLADLAVHLNSSGEETRRWRLFREFLKEFRHAPAAHRAALLATEPSPVDHRWDALLAAVAEHLAWHHGLRCPEWTHEPSRFLCRFWFTSALPTARVAALETSPAAFRRRGIFLDRSELDAA